MGKLAIISESTVRKIVTRQLAFDAVREAFEAVAMDRKCSMSLSAADAIFKAAQQKGQIQFIEF